MVVMSILISKSFTAFAGPMADYGDAPDDTAGSGVVGKYPSMYNTGNARIVGWKGAHHLETDEE